MTWASCPPIQAVTVLTNDLFKFSADSSKSIYADFRQMSGDRRLVYTEFQIHSLHILGSFGHQAVAPSRRPG